MVKRISDLRLFLYDETNESLIPAEDNHEWRPPVMIQSQKLSEYRDSAKAYTEF